MAKRVTRSEEESYRVMFFIISSLIMASMVWLIYQEFFTRRPWADVQAKWYKVQEERAAKNLESERNWLKEGVIIEQDDEGEEEEIEVGPLVKELNDKISSLNKGIVDSPERAKFDELTAKIAAAQIEVKDQEMLVAFTKAAEDEYYYYYRRDKHHDDADGEQKNKAEVEAIQKRVAEEQAKYDAKVAVRDALIDEKGKIVAEVRAAELKLTKLRGNLVTAQRTFDKAEKSANSLFPREMLQHWNQKIELVDRCHTCHMGAEKCGFTYPKEILQDAVKNEMTAAQIKKKYCTSREEAETYAEKAEEIRDSFGEDEELNYEAVKDDLGLDSEPVLAMAKKLNMEQYEAESLFRSHPNRTLLLRKHPGGQYGCTTCHYGQGRQTKGVALNLLKGDTAPFTHATRDHYWLSQILDPVRRVDGTKPEDKHFTEASCYNCHKADYELEAAPHLTEARKLVQHLGCTGCHPLGTIDPERKHGPGLDKLASKINPGWLSKWIEYPKSLRPRTRMPNFWPEVDRQTPEGERPLGCNEFDYKKGAAKSPAVPQDCEEKRDSEVAYISYYLLEKSEKPKYPAMPAWANAKAGQEVFEAVGCMACHNLQDWDGASDMPGSGDRDIAPNLTNIGDKISDPGWFFTWVKNPKSYWHETRMPKLKLTDKEAWNVSAYLSSLKSGTDYSQLPAESFNKYVKGKEEEAKKKGAILVNWYGCTGCHEMSGHEAQGRIGAELIAFGSKPVHKLDFGDVPEFASDHHAQSWEAWTRRKLYDPRSYRYERVETRMPQFDLTPKEIDLVTLFLRSQNLETEGWPDEIRKQHNPQELAVQRGAYLVDIYNCRGCHLIDERGIDIDGDHVNDGGDIYRWFAAHEEEMYRAPPKLVNIGKKLYPDWLYAFLKEPFKLRENYKIRMPNFQFTDEVTSDIVAYFAAKSKASYPYVEKKVDTLSAADKKTAEALFTASQCLNCHNLGGPSNDPKNIAPNLALTADRLQYDWLFDWLKDPSSQIPGVAMPGFFIYDEDADDYMTPLPQYADGDWKRQVELLRAYVISLGAKQGSKVAGKSSGDNPDTASLRD